MIIKKLWVTGGSGHRWELPARWEGVDFFPVDGPRPEHFALTASDYGEGDNLLVCPCDWTTEREMLLGEMLDQAQAHIEEKHQRASS